MKRWVLRRRPLGESQPGDLERVGEPIPDLPDGKLLIQVSPEP